jgi:hypothetical protein
MLHTQISDAKNMVCHGCKLVHRPENVAVVVLLLLQLVLLRKRWYIILGCLCMQYVHGIFTQLAYRMHTPAHQPLHDVGFAIIPVSRSFLA